MTNSKWTFPIWLTLTVALLLSTGLTGQGEAGKVHVAPKSSLIKKDKPADLLKAARLELKSGRTDVALQFCLQIKRRYPDNSEITPKALVMGAEIYLRRKRPDQARFWTGSALKMFTNQDDYQRRMAILHRRALTMVTRREEKHPAYRTAWTLLRSGYKARGLSCHEIRIKWFRFWREIRAHRRNWDRPGVEGKDGFAPAGIRRHFEVIAARLTQSAFQARGKKVKALDELVKLLPVRIKTLRKLWTNKEVTARDHRQFEAIMDSIGKHVSELRRLVYRGKGR